MDNWKGQKNWTVIAGLNALVTLGIVQKVKLSFGLACHGHTDIDATIAKVIEKVCNADLPTFLNFMNACKDAIGVSYSKVIEVFTNRAYFLYLI
jgi:hypothetical protein